MGYMCLMMLMLFSCYFVGLCHGGDGTIQQPPCMKQLLPCSTYLHQQSPPPSTCCVPLKQLISTDVKCLCDVFTNPAVMISLNVTQADAMNLANSCGANVGKSMCKDAESAPTVSPSPSNSPSSNTNSTAGGPSKSAASHISKLGGSSILVILYCCMSMF